MGIRRKAREFAVQSIYAQELGESYWKDVINEFTSLHSLDGFLKKFYIEICEKYFNNSELINKKIKIYIKNWSYERVAFVDKAILRVAITEMIFFDDIPANVSIDEAIEIAKRYSTEKSGGFINGVLDAIKIEENLK